MTKFQKIKRRMIFPVKYWFHILPYFVMSNPAVARDLESIATNLSTKTGAIANLLVPLGFAISAIFMIVGHPRGAQFMSTTLMAALISLGGSSVFNWLKNVVG
ncbi:MAG: hypothetical protein ACXVLQ_14470 [Bacteriovorax sp.]